MVFHNSPDVRIKRFAVECKFSEAYGGRKHGGLKPKYLEHTELWQGIPHLRAFAEQITPEDNSFNHLHPAQLVKHILALKGRYGRQGFRLLYLWYDVFGGQGKQHREEILEFTDIAKRDDIKFHSLTYQELIVNLTKMLGAEHADYMKYLTERYL